MSIPVRRWRAALVATLALVAVGLLYASTALLAGAAVPLTYAVYGAVSRVPADASVSAKRAIEPSDPDPGGTATVSLTITNTGERTLTDVRVVDRVPDDLAVASGSPRAGFALRPGESATVEYEVHVARGEHTFGAPVIRLRSTAASEQATREVEPAGDRQLTCAAALEEPPLADASLRRTGRVPTDDGGSGLSFFATREYRRGDPLGRIDWRHYAKTGDFVTVQYRQERAVRTVVVVDGRDVGRVTARPGHPTGTELCAYAAERLYDALDGVGLTTSVTALGLGQGVLSELAGPDGLPWVDDDTGRSERVRTLLRHVRDALESQPAAGAATADGGRAESDRLLARLPPTAQVVLCTPLLDDWPVETARSLVARGYPVLVLSPDVTGGESTGSRVEAVRRDTRVAALQRTEARVVGWNPDRPVDRALREGVPHLL